MALDRYPLRIFWECTPALKTPRRQAKIHNVQRKRHAESLVAAHLAATIPPNATEITVYMRGSKLACFPCHAYVAAVAGKTPFKIAVTSTHGKTYGGWSFPPNDFAGDAGAVRENLADGVEAAHAFLLQRQHDSTPPEGEEEEEIPALDW